MQKRWIVILVPGFVGVAYLVLISLPLGTSSIADSVSEKSVRNFVILTLVLAIAAFRLTREWNGS